MNSGVSRLSTMDDWNMRGDRIHCPLLVCILPRMEGKRRPAVQAGRRSLETEGFLSSVASSSPEGVRSTPSPRFQIYDGGGSLQLRGARCGFSAWSNDESCLLRYPTVGFRIIGWRSSQTAWAEMA